MRAERRHVRRHEALGALRWSAGAVALAAVTACGGIAIKPDPVLPQPLLQPLPSTVGLVLPNELRNYVHQLRDIFKDSFSQVQEFKDLAAARAGTGLKAVFEPLIDQYSFVTDRDTGGRYDAVTIRYRINVYTPLGEKVDTLTLTGYGSALAKGLSSGAPLERATLAAMRDAAAKFLVQFPEQAAGQQLAHDEALSVQSGFDTADNLQIEAVPIEESGPDGDAGAPTA